MGARLFTAVLPPESVAEDLSRHLEPRREAGIEHWRWTRPEGWHLTTAFMASVSTTAQDALVDHLGGAIGRTEPFDVGLEGAVCFPNAAQARVLAMAVTTGAAELAALAMTCRGVASHAGAAPDGATFRGHLTLARARRPFDATRWFRIVESFPGWSWRVGEVALVQSHMADRGNRYEILERFPLAQK